MIKIVFITTVLICISFFSYTQPKPGPYRGILYREDGKEVVFNMEVKGTGKQTKLYIINATEKILTKELKIEGDSVFFRMPAFESEFKTQVQPDGSLKGLWLKGTATKTQQWPFAAIPGKSRFTISKGAAKNNITGRWSVTITRAKEL